MNIAIVVIYGLVGYVLASIGHGWDTFEFWCIIVLMVMLENASRILTTDSVIKGIILAAEEQISNEGSNE